MMAYLILERQISSLLYLLYRLVSQVPFKNSDWDKTYVSVIGKPDPDLFLSQASLAGEGCDVLLAGVGAILMAFYPVFEQLPVLPVLGFASSFRELFECLNEILIFARFR